MGKLTNVLDLDLEAEASKIATFVRETLTKKLRKRGAVVAVSGGIDSSVCAALCTRALGPERVFAIMLPERESSARSLELGRMLVEHLGVPHTVQDLTDAATALGCYSARDRAIAQVIPGFGDGWKQKIKISGGVQGQFNHFSVIAQAKDGTTHEQRLPHEQFLSVVAATNYKQRLRKTVEYFHADRLNYAVIGTPNRLEYDQGFFVKNGDGSADLKPIAHLYKTQVYAMARFLGLPEPICSTVPTTDTYTLAQGQDEFYFALPYEQMDLALWAYEHQRPPDDLAAELGVSVEKARWVYADIEAKRRTAEYLHAAAYTLPLHG